MRINDATLTDNPDDRAVEFTAEIDDEEREFAVRYSVIEALSGDVPEDDALELFRRCEDEILDAAAAALARDDAPNVIVITEVDIEA